MKRNGTGMQRHLVGRLAHGLRALRRKAADERGVAAIELAIILPFLLILMLGSVEMFLMSMASRKAARVTSTVGDLVARASGTLTNASIDSYYKAAQYILGKLPKEDMALSIYVYSKKSGSRNKSKVSWTRHLGKYSCQGKPPMLNAAQQGAMRDGNDIVLVYGCYRYPVKIGKLVFGTRTFMLKSQVMFRPRQQMKLACKDC